MRKVSTAYPHMILALMAAVAGAIGSPLSTLAQGHNQGRASGLRFTDVTREAGLYRKTAGWSATFVDFDDDGWLDLHLVPRRYEPSILYRNQGDGTYRDVTEASRLQIQTHEGHATWIDLDNDGDKDCLAAGQSQDEVFLNNGDGTFASMGSLLGRAGTGQQGSLALADYNNDGLVDLFACRTDLAARSRPADRSLLLQNRGEGRFVEVGKAAGLAEVFDAYSAIWLDIDSDRWPDLIVARPFAPFVSVYRNMRDGSFDEVSAEVGLADIQFGFYGLPALAANDMNNDGWMDLTIAGDSIRFFENLNGRFSEMPSHSLPPVSTGVQGTQSFQWADIDNSGWPDLLLIPGAEHLRVWLRRHEGSFQEVSRASGVNEPTYLHYGFCLGDYDKDGDLDLCLMKGDASILYRNDGPHRHWLKIRLQGTASNRDGAGTLVELFSGGGHRVFEARMGSAPGSGTVGEVHLGLGDSRRADSIHVRWPSGRDQTLRSVAADQILVVREPEAAIFEDISSALRDTVGWQTRGAAFSDYDNDGHVDLAVNSGPNVLLHNRGDGTFEEIAEKAGLQSAMGISGGAAWGDFNNDGMLDLFLTRESSRPHHLFLADRDGAFTDVSTLACLSMAGFGGPVVLADFDGNGYLDAFSPAAEPVQMFLNQGDTTFIEVAGTSGFEVVEYGPTGLSGCSGDYDNDGDIDIYLARTSLLYRKRDAPNVLLQNRGDGTFRDVTSKAGVGDSTNSKGAVFADYNNDGWLDLYVANDGGPNRLYRNNRDGAFTDVAVLAGVAEPFFAHSTSFGDFDNDGDLDLYVGGASYLVDSLITYRNPAVDALYRNDGSDPEGVWRFTEITHESGIENLAHCTATAWGDIDNDGDLDLFLGNAYDFRLKPASINAPPFPRDKLYRNRGNKNHWLQLKLVGHKSNRAAIGARVELRSEDVFQMREVEGGGSYGSQNSLRVEFGLGKRERVDDVVIRWPSGIVQKMKDPGIDRLLTVEEPFRAGPVQVERATLARIKPWVPRIAGGAGVLALMAALVIGFRRWSGIVARRVAYLGRSIRGTLMNATGMLRVKPWAGDRTQGQRRATGVPLLKVVVDLVEFKDDFLLTHHVHHIQNCDQALAAFPPEHHPKHAYTIRAAKMQHLIADFDELFKSFERYMLNGVKPEFSALDELRDLGRRVFRFFGMAGFLERLFGLRTEEPLHLSFVLDSPKIPWHLAYDDQQQRFLSECFPYAVSFGAERVPSAVFRSTGSGTGLNLDDKTALLFYGDWSGTRRALNDVPGETRDVEKLLRSAGLETQMVYQDIDSFAEAILGFQEKGSNLRVIHYCGHVDCSGLNAGERDYLAPGILRDAFGLTLESRPVVFLNGCSSGRVSDVWNVCENLSTEFLACGAAACVVTDFPVPESTARDFAIRFYHHFSQRKLTAGEALRCARVEMGEARRAGSADPHYDVTRYFYNLYGDPTAKL